MASAIGTITAGQQGGGSPSDPTFFLNMTMVGDGAYPTGGTTGFAAALSTAYANRTFSKTSIVFVHGRGTMSSVGYYLKYDAANDLLLVYRNDTGAQVSNATDISSMTFDVFVIAK